MICGACVEMIAELLDDQLNVAPPESGWANRWINQPNAMRAKVFRPTVEGDD